MLMLNTSLPSWFGLHQHHGDLPAQFDTERLSYVSLALSSPGWLAV
jgi:hypothetical protein